MHRGCILALLQWLWRRGKTGRAIAALAELSDCEREASSCMAICAGSYTGSCTGSSDAGSLYATALTRAAAAALISQGDAEPAELYRLVTIRCIFRITDRFGRKLAAASGVIATGRTKSDRVTEMSQSDAWPSDSSTVDALSRYKQQFTASVKLHTSPARATWDDRSANVPLQTIWPLPWKILF